jgi:methylglyoxal synthase
MAYAGILYSHNLYAPNTTGQLVANATGLSVTQLLPCASGGYEQIASRIGLNQIDMVLFFCDPSGRIRTDDMEMISRACDKYTVPYASNIATAEVLVQGLKHGDLDWRKYLK